MRLDRYIFGEALRPSLLGLGFYTFVMIMNQLFLVARQAMQRGLAPSIVAQLLALALPKILVFTIPMALLLGVLIGMGRLSADSEVIALRAAGVSYLRMARPILMLGLIGFATTATIYNIGVPWSIARIEKLHLELLRKTDPNREIRAGVFYDEIPDTLLYAEHVVRDDPTWPLRQVFIETDRYDPIQSTRPESEAANPPATEAQAPVSSRTETLVCGSRGRVEMAPDGSQVTFVIDSGEVHHNDPDAPLGYQMFRFQKPMITVVPLAAADSFGEPRQRAIAELHFRELIDEMKAMSAAPDWRESPARSIRYRRALIELNWRFSVPAASLVFCLLAFPLGLINHRGGKASGFAISIIVIMLYWVALDVGSKFAADGRVSEFVGAWAPDLLVLAAAIGLLLMRQRRDVFSLPSRTRAWARSMQSRMAAKGGPLPAPVREPRPDSAVFTTTPAPRIRVPLIDIYLGKRYLATFALVLLSAATLYSIVELKTLVESLLQKNLPISLGLKYLVYFLPGMMKVVIPVAAVVAAMVTVGTLCRTNQDTALKAAGVSIFRISAPLLIVTIGLSVVYFLTQDYVAPFTNQRAARIRDEIEGRASSATVAGTRWVFGKDSRLYGFAEYDSAKKALQGVTVVEFAQDPFRVRSRLWSPRVKWNNGMWVASTGWRRTFRGDTEAYSALQKTAVTWPDTPEDFASQERSLVGSDRLAEEMSFLSLRRNIEKLKNSGLDTTRLRVALYEKLAFPAAPLVMVLIGLPFGFRTGRRGSLYGLGIALVLIILYWSCFAVASALGEDEILPPILAAWSPNLIFALAGSYLFLSTRS